MSPDLLIGKLALFVCIIICMVSIKETLVKRLWTSNKIKNSFVLLFKKKVEWVKKDAVLQMVGCVGKINFSKRYRLLGTINRIGKTVRSYIFQQSVNFNTAYLFGLITQPGTGWV